MQSNFSEFRVLQAVTLQEELPHVRFSSISRANTVPHNSLLKDYIAMNLLLKKSLIKPLLRKNQMKISN